MLLVLETDGRAGSCRVISILKGLLSSLGHQPEDIEFQTFPFQFLQNQKGRSFCTALIIFLCCIPSENPKAFNQYFWIKLQTLQVTLEQSFPLPAPQVSRETKMALRETKVIWKRAEGAYCLQNPSYQVRLDTTGSWGPAKAQSPDGPIGKQQAIREGRAETVEASRRDPAQGSGTGLSPCKDLGHSRTLFPEEICSQMKDPGRALRFGRREIRQEMGLLGCRSE